LNLDVTERLICAVLRGENPPWPEARGAGFAGALLKGSGYHGVQALLHARLRGAQSWPSFVVETLHREAISRAMWELRHQQVLTQALAALANIGTQPVILKGTALAYSLYDDPVLRARGDTDLIIRQQQRSQANDALIALGFVPMMGLSGEFIAYQSSYTLEAPNSGDHTVDLHWRITNSELLSRLFSYDELKRQAMPLPHLCGGAVAAGHVHALLLACMHRQVHAQAPYYVDDVAHYSADRLIWLYDIHLLSTVLSSTQWHDVVRLAKDKGLCASCLSGLERARACFHSNYPEFVLVALAEPGDKERPTTYLNSGNVRQQWMDFCAIDGLSNKLQFLRELVWPSAAYMRSKYSGSAAWLPWLYARRACGGVVKRLNATRQTP
jgi:hypothetical protein